MIRFLCDSMLGSLAKQLRMVGIDTEFIRTSDTKILLGKAADERRTVLTRRTVFCKREVSVPFYFIAANDVQSQFDEIMQHFKITIDTSLLLSRCLVCNKQLKKIIKNKVAGLVPEFIFNTNNEFSICPGCKKIYWKGTHYMNMLKYFSASTPNNLF